jgi:ElaB/YqjD/DUF883 family membrane-anchored ribosome-binding protein
MTTTKIDMELEVDTQTTGGRRDNDTGKRGKASDAYNAARERTGAAFGSASERAGRAAERTSETIDTNPMMALAGGLALGAVLAALLPKTRKEEELLGDYGRKINETARDAARAAKEAGTGKLDELGYNRDNIKQKVDALRSDAAEIAAAAAQQIKGDAKQVASAAASDAKEVAGAAASEAKAAAKNQVSSGGTGTTGGTGKAAPVEVTVTTGTTGGTGTTGTTGGTGGTGGTGTF